MMGHYVNPGTDHFQMSLNSEIYIDKSDLIAKTNAVMRTRQRFVCISRPRRFGKTMAAEMLATYYGMGADASCLFDSLAIAKHPSYNEHLNQYHVLMINMQMFLSQYETVEEMIVEMQVSLISELTSLYPDVKYRDKSKIIKVLTDIYLHTKRHFVILIDEWDCILRERKYRADEHKKYLDFLRLLFKDQVYVGLAYMTGILPIKKYGTHSALNMFREYSMTEPGKFLDYFGFQESDVQALADAYQMDMSEMRNWYNGYFVDLGTPIYNPTSVSESLERKRFSSYWNKTETYEALKDYIMLDFDGLKEKVTFMLSGASIPIDTSGFSNDMATFAFADDVLTLLVHLGYLSYNYEENTVKIPNYEVKGEFVTSIKSLKWAHVMDALNDSRKLLQAIWNKDAPVVAEGIEKVHEQNTSILAYNDENALSCVISLALYSANDYYTITRELPTGKGYADLVFIPRTKHKDKPALIVELKWNRTVNGAISQIKEKNYVAALEEYHGNLLLVGINYDNKTKVHECVIESFVYGSSEGLL